MMQLLQRGILKRPQALVHKTPMNRSVFNFLKRNTEATQVVKKEED